MVWKSIFVQDVVNFLKTFSYTIYLHLKSLNFCLLSLQAQETKPVEL